MAAAAPLQPRADRHRGSNLRLHRGTRFGEVSIASPRHQTRANSTILPVGTAVALNTLTKGVAALPASTPGRGGARNSASRLSHELSTAHIANLVAATGWAKKIGLPFTRMITIHWEAAGVPLDGMAKATGRYLDLLGKMLLRHGGRAAWLWVHENGPGKGGHCHMLVHVPAALVGILGRLQRGWLRKITGNPYRTRVIYSRPVGSRLGVERSSPDLHAVNLARALGYVVKGASMAAAEAFELQELEPGGPIIGKRCGTSQNIGAKARKAKD